MSVVIAVEQLSKVYRLGTIGGGTLREDISRWWAKALQKPDPTVKIGQEPRHVGHDFLALRDVNFEVNEGDILGIIGRNGAGKSTLLKILSRVTGPTSGLIKIRGRIASLLEVGTGFHPELTGRENIFLNGTILGMTKAEIRRNLDEIIAFSEIEDFIDTPVKRYSSGMYVRLAFAVAAHLESEVLIVDEVLAVGDAQFQKKCLGKMDEVSRHGRTVLFVSHNLDAVRNLCRTALVLQDGKLLFSGQVEQGIQRYLSSGVLLTGEVNFNHPMQKPAFFRSAHILNHLGKCGGTVDVRNGFSVQLDYEILESLRNLELSIRVLTTDARPIFTSVLSEALPELLNETQQGLKRATATIPGNFLMPGNYLISIALHEAVGEVFDFHEGVLQVTIEDSGTIFTKYNHNHLIGVVIHPLSWNLVAPGSLVN